MIPGQDEEYYRLHCGWRELKEFYGKWIFERGDLTPVKLTEEYCKEHNISCSDCMEWDKKGFLFCDEDWANHKRDIMLGNIEYDEDVKEAMDAWWNPDKYYDINRR